MSQKQTGLCDDANCKVAAAAARTHPPWVCISCHKVSPPEQPCLKRGPRTRSAGIAEFSGPTAGPGSEPLGRGPGSQLGSAALLRGAKCRGCERHTHSSLGPLQGRADWACGGAFSRLDISGRPPGDTWAAGEGPGSEQPGSRAFRARWENAPTGAGTRFWGGKQRSTNPKASPSRS